MRQSCRADLTAEKKPVRIKLLILTDFHYYGEGKRGSISSRRGDLIPSLLDQIRMRETDCDAVAVLGDLINDGTAPDARGNLHMLRERMDFNVPLIAIPGNHDSDPARFAEVFGEPKAFCVNGVRLIPFVDSYDADDVCTRDFRIMAQELAAIRPGEIAVTLQHNTILPEIRETYPYTPVRFREIHAAYRDAGVKLSLSGHFHPGIDPFIEDGVTYACIPALCESPFRYAVADITEDGINVELRTVCLP